MDKGKDFPTQIAIQEYINIYAAGLRKGLADLEHWKSAYDGAYLRQDFDAYSYCVVRFTDVLPIVACGAFHPEFDFAGNTLQRLGRNSGDYEHVTFNLTVLDGKSVAVIGWPKNSLGPSAAFATSFAEVASAAAGDATIRLCFEHLENIYLRPSWWHQLSTTLQKPLIDRAMTGLASGPERTSSCLLPDGMLYTPGVLVEMKQLHP